MRRRTAFSTLALLAVLASCSGATRELYDPTLLIVSENGRELGVSTDYGVVFLGRYAQGGEVDLNAWFGDGPSLETAVVEPLGHGLYTAEPEIRIPSVPLTFAEPRAGETVTVLGRTGGTRWSRLALVTRDSRVSGILLKPTVGVTGAPEQVGAGVYVGKGYQDFKLLGLISGRVRLVSDHGYVDYVTVLGPEQLWRLVARPKMSQHKPRWVYREDIL
ncbi:MAG: hypothetical protein O7B99_09045 [Planctomycetota bacterium]|nr:hypothetical protein [Planctomycetota bacterium]